MWSYTIKSGNTVAVHFTANIDRSMCPRTLQLIRTLDQLKKSSRFSSSAVLLLALFSEDRRSNCTPDWQASSPAACSTSRLNSPAKILWGSWLNHPLINGKKTRSSPVVLLALLSEDVLDPSVPVEPRLRGHVPQLARVLAQVVHLNEVLRVLVQGKIRIVIINFIPFFIEFHLL